jgi:general secretion pathway protein C
MSANTLKRIGDQLGQEPTQRKLATLTAFVMVIFLAKTLADLTWQMMPAPATDVVAIPADQAPADPQQRGPGIGARIAELNLFGKVDDAPAPAPEPQAAPETRLNLTLRGIIASDNPDRARAIIAEGTLADKFYRMNEELPGGAKLNAIRPDHVILERNGRFETLSLPKERSPEAERLAQQSAAQSNQPRLGAPPNTDGASPTTLSDYRDALKENPQAVNELLNPAPAYQDGKLVGFRLRPTKNRHLLRRNGILRNDIVTSVNGIPLNDPSNSFQVLQQLTSTENIQLTILRNGQEKNVSLNLE